MNKMFKRSVLTILLTQAPAFAGTMGAEMTPVGGTYLGAFGGGGTLSRLNIAQLGTALFAEGTAGGPLAVNAFGSSPSHSMWLVGGNLGHVWSEQSMPYSSNWMLMPAAELEGFYLGQHNIIGDDINNETTRLTEHDFHVTYPMSAGVGLVNALVNFRHANYLRWRPYLGAGLGVALVSVENATSLQISPLEVGINHYNSDASDSSTAFSAQSKVGLNFDYTQHLTLFAEYRYLYIGATDFTFGSTVYPTHVVTTSWEAKMGSQSYNLGVAGIRYTI